MPLEANLIMDSEQAKFILQSFRSSGAHDQETDVQAEPLLAEALEQMKRDPDLAAWFAQEQAFDSVITRKLREVSPPAGLRTEILAGLRVEPPESTARVSRRRWLSGAVAAAGGLLLAAAATWKLRRSDAESATRLAFEKDMSVILDEGFDLDLLAPDHHRAVAWLHQEKAIEGLIVPRGLSALSSVGCRVFDWRDGRVSLICFRTKDNQIIHLFSLPRTALRGDLPGRDPILGVHGNWTMASWTEGTRLYALAGRIDDATLRQLAEPAKTS